MRRLVTSLFLVAMGAIAWSADVATPVAELDAALAARVAAIGSPAPDAIQAAEAKKLGKARKQLAKFKGVVDLAGLTALSAAGKQISASGTVDPGVGAAVADAIAALEQTFDERDAEILTLAGQIYALPAKDKLDLLLAEARLDVDAAIALAPTDAAGALRLLQSAAIKYGKALKFADKTIDQLMSAPQPKIFGMSVGNLNGKPFTIKTLVFDFIYTPPGGGTPVRVHFDYKDHQDGEFVLPYKMLNRDSQFDFGPTFHEALTSVIGGSPNGGSYFGSLHFVSTKHGKVEVPLDDVVFGQ